MKDLISLVKLVSKQKVKQIEIVSENPNFSPKSEKLYTGILSGEITSDEEASLLLYDQETVNPTYRKLKTRFEERLINTLFFIDVNQTKFNEVQRAFHQSHKNFCAVKILIERSNRAAAIKLAERTIIRTLKFDFVDLSLMLAKTLRFHYGAYQINKKKFAHYSKIVKESMHALSAELEIEEAIIFVDSFMIRQKSKLTEETLATAKDQYARMAELK